MIDVVLQQLQLGASGLAWGVIIPIGLGVLFLMWAVGMYNGLIRKRNTVKESWADIETELKRRYNLIPNLVETVKGYAAHEKATLENVVQARNAAASPHASPKEQARDDNILSGALRQLFAVVENYPQLRANENVMKLQEELTSTENRISFARQFYNDTVMRFNTRLQSFPTNLVAGVLGFTAREFFETGDEAEREPVKVDLR